MPMIFRVISVSLIAATIGAFLLYSLITGRTRSFGYFGMEADRKSRPGLYWLLIAIYSAISAILIGITIYALGHTAELGN
jgi:hypothetical protein